MLFLAVALLRDGERAPVDGPEPLLEVDVDAPTLPGPACAAMGIFEI